MALRSPQASPDSPHSARTIAAFSAFNETLPQRCNLRGVILPRDCWRYQLHLNFCGPATGTSNPLLFPAAYDADDASTLCDSLGLESDGTFGGVRLASPPRVTLSQAQQPKSGWSSSSGGSSSRRGRVAACITGQLRGFPLAMTNWQQGSLLQVLSAGGLEIDWFMVTPNSTAYSVWNRFVESLRPVRVELLRSDLVFDTKARAADNWGVREDEDGRTHFNLARFPYFGGKWRNNNWARVVTVLVQQLQMSKCRDAIRAHEDVSGFRYTRVARLRTDVLFSGLVGMLPRSNGMKGMSSTNPGFPVPKAVLAATYTDELNLTANYLACRTSRREPGRSRTKKALPLIPTDCDAMLRRARTRLVRDCKDHLSQLEAEGKHWLTGSDIWMYGSRDVMMEHYFQTLQLLEERGDRLRQININFTHSLEHLRDVWTEPWDSAVRKWPTDPPHDAGACAIATSHNDIVRTAGPPIGRFFLQESETGPEFRRACQPLYSLEECMSAQQGLWALNFAAVGRCVGLSYDLAPGWNSSCDWPELEADLHRAHVRSFGLSLVGDLESWAKNRMQTALVERYRNQIDHPDAHAPDGFRIRRR